MARWIALLSALTLHGQTPTDHHQHLFRSTNPAVHASDLIGLLDRAGLGRAVVLSTAYQLGNPNRPPVENEYDKVKAENDWTGQQVGLYKGRLRGFCGVNPLKAYALAEIDRCAKDPNLRWGIKLHFGNSDVDVQNTEHVKLVTDVLRRASKHRIAVIIHMRPSVTRKRPYGADVAKRFIEAILPAASGTMVQIAHLGGSGGFDDPTDDALQAFADAVRRNDPRMKSVYFDVSGVAGIGNWKERAHRIVSRIRELGVERVLYGSDGTSGEYTPQTALAAFRELPLSTAEFKTIETNVAPYLR